MGGEETKNLILAAVLSMLVVFGWYALFPPEPPVEQPKPRPKSEKISSYEEILEEYIPPPVAKRSSAAPAVVR